MKPKQIFALLRWLAAAALLFTAFQTVTDGAGTGGDESTYELPVIRNLLTGIGIVVVGVALIAPELIAWVSIPITAFFNAIFFPGKKEPPPADYNLTRLYREQERYDEALEVYNRIIQYHPGELLAYIEGIETAFEAGMPEEAEKILRLAQRKLAPEVREHVERVFNTCANQPVATEESGEPVGEENPPGTGL